MANIVIDLMDDNVEAPVKVDAEATQRLDEERIRKERWYEWAQWHEKQVQIVEIEVG